MSNPVTSGAPAQATAPTISPGIILGPRLLHPAPQTASTLGPAPTPESRFFSKIAAWLRSCWNGILSCFSRRATQTGNARFLTFAQKREQGNRVIDEHLYNRLLEARLHENPSQLPGNKIAVFIMEYRDSCVTCFKKINEGDPDISIFAKTCLGAFFSQIEINDGRNDANLLIKTLFFEVHPNRQLITYTKSESALSPLHTNYYTSGTYATLSPQHLSNIVNSHIPNPVDRIGLLAEMNL